MPIVRAKERREREQEEKVLEIKAEKEREIARLRAMQEKARDQQAELDALRARRAQEDGSIKCSFFYVPKSAKPAPFEQLQSEIHVFLHRLQQFLPVIVALFWVVLTSKTRPVHGSRRFCTRPFVEV